MRYATVCSGIEAPTVAWEPLGWKAQWFSEIERFPSQVLAHHYPSVPNLGDMTQIHKHPHFQDATFDLLCGGTPCQSFSVAGLRKGLADPRGNLMLTFLALADAKRPRWLVWENVPGVLSSNRGRDFGTFLGALAELGYGWAYRVLDAQYFGVAQRRRRVFVVGCLGSQPGAAAVLFERYCLSGHPAPIREAKQEIAGTLTSGASRRRGSGIDPGELVANTLLSAGHTNNPSDETLVCHPLTYSWQNQQQGIVQCSVSSALRANGTTTDERTVGAYAIQAGALRENPLSGPDGLGVQIERAYTIEARSEVQAVAYRTAGDGAVYENGNRTSALVTSTDRNSNIVGVFSAGAGAKSGGIAYSETTSPTLKATDCGNNRSPTIHLGMAVRRLVPVECERLQGFADGYTDIQPNGKPTPDGPRYKALGNSMATPVVHAIGQRIDAVDKLLFAQP